MSVVLRDRWDWPGRDVGRFKHIHRTMEKTDGKTPFAKEEPKRLALRYILDAWEEALFDGIDSDCVATAAIFAALSDMIATYGEEPVASMTERLPERIRAGEFTVVRTRQ
jgi:predicted YcjX-like family ATPase